MDFIKEFHQWVRRGRITDAPDLYIDTTALQILSMNIGRTFFMYLGRKKVYANLWCILIGKSSMFRKSTCLDLAKSFINDNLVFPDEYSSEKLIETISYKRTGIMTIDEIMSVSKLWSRDYAQGVKPFLTQLFDAEKDYKRETFEYTLEVKEPYLNIFACSTPVWFQEALSEEDIYGGFLPRFLLIYIWNKKYSYKFPGRGDQKKEEEFREFLKNLNKKAEIAINKELKFSKASVKRFSNYASFIEKLICQEGNGLSPFLIRLLTYLIKVSILLHFSNTKNWNSNEVSLKTLNRAIRYIDSVRLTTEKILSRMSFSSYQVLRNKILELLEVKEKIQYSELLHKLRVPKTELKKVLDTLVDEEMIEISLMPTKTKPMELIKLKHKEEKTIT